MKKMLSTLLIVLFLSSCADSSSLYTIHLSGYVEGDYFDESVTVEPIVFPNNELIEDATEKTVQIGAQQIVAKPVEIINYGDGSKSNVFQTMDGAVRYVIYDSNSEFRITANNGKSLKDFASAVLSEESLLEHIKSYICCFLPDFDFEKKVYSCTTSVDVSGEHSLWREDREQFCIAEQENEEVISYTISFVEHEQGIATEDRVEILCDELGNIKNFYYCEKGIDWSVVNVDQKNSRKVFRNFLKMG